MKKALIAAFAILLVTSCSAERKEPEGNMRWIDVYYADSGKGIIASEQRAIVVEDRITAHIKDAIEQMQQTPTGNDLKPLIPENVKLLRVSFDHGVAKIEFSREYLAIEGIDKSVTDYGILMTLSNFWNVQAVEITVDGTIVTPEFSRKDIVAEIPNGQS